LRSRPVAGSADKKYTCECAHDVPIPKKRLATALKRRPMTFHNERCDTREWSSTVPVTARGGSGGGGGGEGGDAGGAGGDGGDGGGIAVKQMMKPP
jgi:hypothetical protein